MTAFGCCDCAQSLAGALGGAATATWSNHIAGSAPAPIVDCMLCAMPSVEPELADITAFGGLLPKN